MADIFISHSKRDAEAVAAFCNIFARTNIRAILAEFEQYAIPPWVQIKEYVQRSSAVFVLLSPELSRTPYTQNWVSYEVGLSCALNKPVWVYEQAGNPVNFPIPYLTDYVIYDPRSREHLEAIKRMLESYDPTPNIIGLALGGLIGGLVSGGAGAGLGALLGAAAMQRKPPGIRVRCPHQNCGVTFSIYSPFAQLQCPACRQVFQITWNQG
jgi:hypothetical protein